MEASEPKKRGYPLVHPPLMMAGIHLLEQMGCGDTFRRRETLNATPFLIGSGSDREGRRYFRATLDFLESQDLLREERDGRYLGFRGLRNRLKQSEVIERVVRNYEAIVGVMEGTLGFEGKEGDRITVTPEHVQEFFHREYRDRHFFEASLPAAATFFHETNLSQPLARGEAVKSDDIVDETRRVFAQTFFDLLKRMEILETDGADGTHVRATPSGETLFKLGSYPELVLSYYGMFANLPRLMRGEIRYGLDKDIYRHGECNARASNGMTAQRVAPYIVDALSTVPVLQEKMSQGGVYVDYGSGGGEMLLRIAQAKTEDEVPHLFGIDFNPRAITAATKLAREAKLDDRIHLVNGSILDEATLQRVKDEIQTRGLTGRIITSINAILHDIGPQASREFLKLHAKVFGDAPLIVTEILRMPLSVIRAHPDYQAASFQYMHDCSGQYLFQERELEGFLQSCGYQVLERKVHASMPGEREGERLNTIVTWIVQYRPQI